MIAQANDSCSAVRRVADWAIPRWKNNTEYNTKVNRNYSESGKCSQKAKDEIGFGDLFHKFGDVTSPPLDR